MSDHERIWLQNANDAGHTEEGRLWCPDKVWPDEPEEGEPTEYVRADLYAAAQTKIERLRDEVILLTHEIERLRAENERLEVENERLHAEFG